MNSHGPQDDTNPDLPRSDVLSTAASAASIATAVYTLGKDIPKLFSSNQKIILQLSVIHSTRIATPPGA